MFDDCPDQSGFPRPRRPLPDRAARNRLAGTVSPDEQTIADALLEVLRRRREDEGE